jgi:UDP-GlcNAc3NAcA epimerase
MPIAHVEAGLRSFNMRMPEEINRILSDRVSTLLFCPTDLAVANLAREGLTSGVYLVGDVMFDMALHMASVAAARTNTLSRIGVAPKGYALATCHRAENTDDPTALAGIIRGLAGIAALRPVVLPIHPRTRAKIAEYGMLDWLKAVTVIEPVSYLDMVTLEKNAEFIVTDSGGVQKEAFFYRVPCITTREETEWVETVDAGWNMLVGNDPAKITSAVESLGHAQRREVNPYGFGDAAERILDLLIGQP